MQASRRSSFAVTATIAAIVMAGLFLLPNFTTAQAGGAVAQRAAAMAAQRLTASVMSQLEPRIDDMVNKAPIPPAAKDEMKRQLMEAASKIVEREIQGAMGGRLPNPVAIVQEVMRELATVSANITAGLASGQLTGPASGAQQGAPTPQDNRQMQDRMQQQIQGTPAQAPAAPPPPPRPAPPPAELRPFFAVHVSGHRDPMVNNILQTDVKNALVRSEFLREAPRYEEFQTAVANERARVERQNQQLSESRIVEIAKQHGVQRVCVASMVPILESYYITVKIIDTRNGNVLVSGELDSPLSSLTDVRGTSAKLAEMSVDLVISIPPPRFCRVAFFNERQLLLESQLICGDPLGDAIPQGVASTQFGTRFGGWFGIDDRQEYNAQSIIERNVRVSTEWTKELCRIEFFNGGHEIKSDTLRCGQEIGNRIPRNLPPVPRYRFAGWFDANGMEQTAQSVVNEDLRISTRWQKEFCVVTFFNVNNELSSDTIRCGTPLDTLLPIDPPEPPSANIRFAGWVDSDRNEYTASTIINDDARIGARWMKDRCRVAFLSGDDEVAADSVSCGEVLGGAIPSDAPTRENHRFVKWLNADGSEAAHDTRITNDVQITAQFVRQCRVDIIQGFEPARTAHIDCGRPLGNLMPPAQTHADYHFHGWFSQDNADYRTAAQVVSSIVVNDNMSIYARWTEKFKPTTSYGVRLAGNMSRADIDVFYSDGTEIGELTNSSSGVGAELGFVLDLNFARYNHFITGINVARRTPVNISEGGREFIVDEAGISLPALYRLRFNGIFGEFGFQLDIPLSDLEDRSSFDFGFAIGGGFFVNRNIGFDIRRVWGTGKYLDISGQSESMNQTTFGVIYMF